MLSSVGCIRATNTSLYSICRRQLYSSSKPHLTPKHLTQYFTKHNIVSMATNPVRFYKNLSVDQKARVVGYWLLGCCGLVATTVSVGGVTRLTESGLSMTDWKFAGRRAPRKAEEWEVEFDKYKASPQWKYQVVHSGMTLNEFKFIWYMEWGHRHLGRVIGTCVVFPTLALLTRPWVSNKLKLRLAGFSSLVVFQGFLGWYMVKSGLEDHPESTDIPR